MIILLFIKFLFLIRTCLNNKISLKSHIFGNFVEEKSCLFIFNKEYDAINIYLYETLYIFHKIFLKQFIFIFIYKI